MTSESLVLLETSAKAKLEEISANPTPEPEEFISSKAADNVMKRDDENPEIFATENAVSNEKEGTVKDVTGWFCFIQFVQLYLMGIFYGSKKNASTRRLAFGFRRLMGHIGSDWLSTSSTIHAAVGPMPMFS